jgi:hypothetical protein
MAGGAIIRGDDGSVYFVRDEILEQCKVEGEYVDNVERLLAEDEVEGFAYNVSNLSSSTSIKYVSGSLMESPKMDFSRVASTIMCPW